MHLSKSCYVILEKIVAPVQNPTPLTYLQQFYGFDAFRDHQETIINRVLSGEHTLLIMPTGGGKSLCYQIPALILDGVGIIVSPLIALMQDQVAGLQQLGIKAAFLNSSLNPQEQREVEQAARKGAIDLLYVAPERLMSAGFKRLLTELNISLFAIDEAHCISQWGHDFRPEYMQLTAIREQFANVPWIAVTATADHPTQQEILKQLHIPKAGLTITGFDRPNIRYTVTLKKNPKKQLLSFIQKEHAGNSGIVYRFSRKKVEETAKWLQGEGYTALPYHAGLPNNERAKNQQRFIQEEGIIIVATIAFGMGIDKPNVRFVAHLDAPKSLEAYYQETGRAGRDGLPADAWMAYSLADIVAIRKLQEGSDANEKQRRVENHKLNQLFGYCESVACRRQVLLNYFGQANEAACGNCDTCTSPVEQWDGTVAAQKVMSCIARTGQRFGAGHVIDVLLGKETDKIHRFGHDKITTYGIGKDYSAVEWRAIIRQLVANDFLRVDVTGFGGIQLNSSCEPVLKGTQTVHFRKENKPAPRSRRQQVVVDPSIPERPDDKQLFESLRKLRQELARNQGVPPYIVFGDATLRAMVQHRPSDKETFSHLSGVGDVKLQRYADAFLHAIREHTEAL